MIALLTSLALLASPTAIENVRLEVGDGTVIEGATVLFDGDTIRSVGHGAAPAGATRIDGTGKVLSPGLVEVRSQLGLVEVTQVEQTRDYALSGGPLQPGFRAADGFNPASVLIPVARAYGITHAVTSPRGGIIAGTAAWIDLSGRLDRRPSPSEPIAMFGAVGERAAASAGGARGGTWLTLRRLIEDTRFYAKNRAAYQRGDSRALLLPPSDLEAMRPVVDGKLPLALVAQRSSDILAALELAKQERLRLIILGGAEAWKVADRLAEARVPVVLSITDQMPSAFEALAARDDAAAVLHTAGVPILLSSGGWTHNARRVRQEAGLAVAYGLPHAEAIAAITSRPAAVFGHANQGVVRKGKQATLVLWSGDPLELSTVAEAVWIDGERQSLDNRQRQLAERYRKPKR